MNEDKFWNLIENAVESSGGEPDTKLESLREELSRLSPEQLIQFRRIYDKLDAQAYRWDLWAAAYILHGGCSDDAFMDFRASLICSGKKVFQDALQNPDSLAQISCDNPGEDLFYEGYQYLPAQLYEEKTGDELPPTGVPFPSEPSGKAWEEDSGEVLQQICPILFKKYG